MEKFIAYLINDMELFDAYLDDDIEQFTSTLNEYEMIDGKKIDFDNKVEAQAFINGWSCGVDVPNGNFCLLSWRECDKEYIELVEDLF